MKIKLRASENFRLKIMSQYFGLENKDTKRIIEK